MSGKTIALCWSVIGALAFTTVVQAVTIETVPTDDPGNTGELSGPSAGGWGADRICGTVSYTYNIGKYEVTAAQYTDFLNVVAKTDSFGLYNTSMWSSTYGCKILQSGLSGQYTYTVATDYADHPVNYVSYWDACRFANWLQNGQPTGAQGAGTTETGAYTLTSDGMTNYSVVRNTDWKWALPSEDEWYKAAYYKGGGINAGYWDYPTESDTKPGQDMADGSGNNANHYTPPYAWPLDSDKFTTLVGEFQNSKSPYGTFDQGGNVSEWTETKMTWNSYVYRGGSFGLDDGLDMLAASVRRHQGATFEASHLGFRVVSVPEPGSIAILLGCAMTLPVYVWRWRKRAAFGQYR